MLHHTAVGIAGEEHTLCEGHRVVLQTFIRLYKLDKVVVSNPLDYSEEPVCVMCQEEADFYADLRAAQERDRQREADYLEERHRAKVEW